jgi:uridine kinase
MIETREAALRQLAVGVSAVTPGHPTRVAVDGITAAGKSTLVAELGRVFDGTGRSVITLSMDGFHRPRADRYRQGRHSAVGYYEDAYDFAAFVDRVLLPLGPGGSRRYRRSVHDLATDAVVDEDPIEATADAVLLVDGSFLQRPELDPYWDYRIFVNTSFSVARSRAIRRDAELLGGEEAAAELYEFRYHPACRLYLESVDPEARADVVIDNDDPARPTVRASGTAGTAGTAGTGGTAGQSGTSGKTGAGPD